MSGQQGQQMNGQEMSGQQMDGMQMAQPNNKNGGNQDGQGGSTVIKVVNPIILIASNAGGDAQTQQMNSPVQPPAATHTVSSLIPSIPFPSP